MWKNEAHRFEDISDKDFLLKKKNSIALRTETSSAVVLSG